MPIFDGGFYEVDVRGNGMLATAVLQVDVTAANLFSVESSMFDPNIFDSDIFDAGGAPPEPTSLLHRWTGSVQQPVKARRWNGSAWEEVPIRRWNGSVWVVIS
jgi:hypothetical protein